MGTIEKRSSESGQVTFRAKVRLKGHRLETATFKRKTDAAKWVQATEAAIRDGRYFEKSEAKRHTVADLIDRYLERVAPKKKASELKKRQQLAWWRTRLGERRLSEVTSALINECKEELEGKTSNRIDKKTGEKLSYSNATVNRYLAAISHVFSVGSKEYGWVNENPVTKISKLGENGGRVRFLDDEERSRLLAACKKSKNSNLYLAVVLSLSTGARQREIWDLQWSQVDLKRNTLTILKTKNKEVRGLPLRGLALELLSKHSKLRSLHSPFVFPGKSPNKSMDFRTAWEGAIHQAGIENFRYHDLRHSAASYLAMNGASLPEIAEVLGHKSFQMVKRYAHLAPEHTGKVVAAMNEKIFADEK